jgi:hypothetical protein
MLQAHAAECFGACGCRDSRQCQQGEVNTAHEDGSVRQMGIGVVCLTLRGDTPCAGCSE